MALVALMALPTLANHPGDRDCPSFDTQAQAQAFFIRHGGPESDGDRLDGNDDDGKACETYDYGSSGGNGNGNGNGGNGDDDDNAPPPDNGDDPVTMPPTSTPSGTAPILPMMLVGLFGGSALLLYRKRLAL